MADEKSMMPELTLDPSRTDAVPQLTLDPAAPAAPHRRPPSRRRRRCGWTRTC